MADEKSEEFRRFILENREIIEKILKEGKESEEKIRDDVKEDLDSHYSETKEKLKGTGEAIFEVMSDDEVQKHFVTACLEFLHFVEAVIKAAPLSPEAREAADKFEEAKDNTVKNVVSVAAKDKMDRVKTDEPKPKTAPKKEPESIKINDVKTSTKKTTKKKE